MRAQDPGELFDLYTESGAPLGRAKPRALVHRDGDWHRSLHVWVVLQGGPGIEGAAPGPWLLFQQRSPEKDTWPGALDVAVTGHLQAGETVLEALREAREEIGLDLGPDDVIRIGLRRRVDTRTPGVVDREIQDIFVALTPLPLRAFRPDPAEVVALVAVPFDAAGALFRGERAFVQGARLESEAELIARVDSSELIPVTDGYYARAHRSIAALLDGEPAAPWESAD
jgi:isopentenyldiphosphate isomerase